jgi:hypothetical protein
MSVGANLVFAQTGTSRRKRRENGDRRQGDGRTEAAKEVRSAQKKRRENGDRRTETGKANGR